MVGAVRANSHLRSRVTLLRPLTATDKIYVEFTCNRHLLGTEIEVRSQLVLSCKVDGTADISRVTLIRNEQNFQQWEPGAKTFAKSFTDESPASGENRYYLRIEQPVGNMPWSSPVWVQVRP